MDVHQHRSELGQWRFARRAAHPRLRAFVNGYLATSSFLPKPVRERLLPSAETPLLLNFGAPHRRLECAGTPQWTSRDGAWVVGLHDRPQLSDAVGERDFMVVRFTPLGAHHFLKIPMRLIEGRSVELCALDPKLADRLMSCVGGAQSWNGRFDAMEALIAERVANASTPGSLASTWRKLEASDGCIRIADLASEAGCSHRALIDQFRTYAGVTPKAVARLLRFSRAIRSLDRSAHVVNAGHRSQPYLEIGGAGAARVQGVRWADLAADCGYSDQAHFIKEFRQFAGTTPAHFLAGMADLG